MAQIFITPLPSNPKIQDTFFVSNANAVKIKITNADHIRSMTDEELAQFIASGVPKDVCRDRCGGDEGYPCSECVLYWLKEESGDFNV